MDYKDKVKDYLPEFIESLEKQLNEDEARWGETWKNRPYKGQSERFRATFDNYFDSEKHGGEKVPWLKIAGNALIGWIREQEHSKK